MTLSKNKRVKMSKVFQKKLKFGVGNPNAIFKVLIAGPCKVFLRLRRG